MSKLDIDRQAQAFEKAFSGQMNGNEPLDHKMIEDLLKPIAKTKHPNLRGSWADWVVREIVISLKERNYETDWPVRCTEIALSLGAHPSAVYRIENPVSKSLIKMGPIPFLISHVPCSLAATQIFDRLLDKSNSDRDVCLLHAVRKNKAEFVSILLVRGVDPNVRVRGDGTPALWHVSWRDEAVLDILVEHGANIHAHFEDIGSPLSHAIQMHAQDARECTAKPIIFFLDRGADLNAGGQHRAWHRAIHPKIMNLLPDLFAKGARIDKENSAGVMNMLVENGQEFSEHADRKGILNMLDLLIERGADLTIKNEAGMSVKENIERLGLMSLADIIGEKLSEIDSQTLQKETPIPERIRCPSRL